MIAFYFVRVGGWVGGWVGRCLFVLDPSFIQFALASSYSVHINT